MESSNKSSLRLISFLLFWGLTVMATVKIFENRLTSELKFTSVISSSIATSKLLAQSSTESTQPLATEEDEDENLILEVAKLFLEFLKILVWPLVAIYFLQLFKPEFKKLLQQRLIQAEVLGNKFVFQPINEEAPATNPEAKVEISQVTPAGFFTRKGIKDIVSQSGLLSSGEEAISELLLFDNLEQHTWIVASRSHFLIVLDDSNTRENNQLIQMVMNPENTQPLQFRPAGENAGVVKFGEYKPWWYYSIHLFPTYDEFKKSFQELLNKISSS